jgi:hypothetical protein
MITDAVSQGITLDQVLDLTSKAEDKPAQSPRSENMVQVVFSHVLEDDKSPGRLVALVVTRLAEYLDLSLWEKLAHRVNHSISLLIIKAILQSRQAKIEGSVSRGVE